MYGQWQTILQHSEQQTSSKTKRVKMDIGRGPCHFPKKMRQDQQHNNTGTGCTNSTATTTCTGTKHSHNHRAQPQAQTTTTTTWTTTAGKSNLYHKLVEFKFGQSHQQSIHIWTKTCSKSTVFNGFVVANSNRHNQLQKQKAQSQTKPQTQSTATDTKHKHNQRWQQQLVKQTAGHQILTIDPTEHTHLNQNR